MSESESARSVQFSCGYREGLADGQASCGWCRSHLSPVSRSGMTGRWASRTATGLATSGVSLTRCRRWR
jgi:hypothetical protein